MTPRADDTPTPTPRVPGMKEDSTKRAARRARRRRRFRSAPRCALCGYDVPEGFRAIPRHLFERHHPAGGKHDRELVILVCANHHAILTAGQLDDAVPLGHQRSVLERMIAVLEALASFFRHFAEALIRWAQALQGMRAGLDTEYPAWRGQTWAR